MRITTEDQVFLRMSSIRKAIGEIWFIHGFGESGLSFLEAFSSPLADKYNLFVPDFPGFGVSPLHQGAPTVRGSAKLLAGLIKKRPSSANIFLVAHSLGGIVATQACKFLSSRVRALVSIEGNMTKADAFFSGRASLYASTRRFQADLMASVSKQTDKAAWRRYLASLAFADPRALLSWGKSGACATGETKAGQEFCGLNCRKLYLWSDDSTPPRTREFIEYWNVPNKRFHRKGHWPMISSPKSCYASILNFLSSSRLS